MQQPVETQTPPLLAYAWIGALAGVVAVGGAWVSGWAMRTWIPDYHLQPYALRDLLVRFALIGVAAAPGVLAIVCGLRARRRGIVPVVLGALITLFWLATYAYDTLH
jgi:hypothetical protein